MEYINKNQENNLNNSIMILTRDVGNGICDKLRIHNLNNYEQETFDFCANNNLDFLTEINNQIQKVINDNKIFNNDNEPNNNKQSNNIQNNNQIKKNIKKGNNNNSNKRKNIPNKKIINRYNSNALLSGKTTKNLIKMIAMVYLIIIQEQVKIHLKVPQLYIIINKKTI